jgi:hypothetical protein
MPTTRSKTPDKPPGKTHKTRSVAQKSTVRTPSRATVRTPSRATVRTPSRATVRTPSRATGRTPSRATGRTPGRVTTGKTPSRSATVRTSSRATGRMPILTTRTPIIKKSGRGTRKDETDATFVGFPYIDSSNFDSSNFDSPKFYSNRKFTDFITPEEEHRQNAFLYNSGEKVATLHIFVNGQMQTYIIIRTSSDDPDNPENIVTETDELPFGTKVWPMSNYDTWKDVIERINTEFLTNPKPPGIFSWFGKQEPQFPEIESSYLTHEIFNYDDISNDEYDFKLNYQNDLPLLYLDRFKNEIINEKISGKSELLIEPQNQVELVTEIHNLSRMKSDKPVISVIIE